MNRDMRKLIEEHNELQRKKKLSRYDDLWSGEIEELKALSINPETGIPDAYLLVVNAYKVGFILGTRAAKRNAKKEKA